jgi:hypothetical protein
MTTESSGVSPRQWIGIAVLGLILVVVNTWPLAPQLAEVGRADSYDGQYGLWQAAWVARALVTDPLHVYDANIFHPHTTTLAFSEPTLLAGILGLPAYLATHSPYATHNLAVLGFFLLSFLGAFALGRYLTGAMWPSLALGIAYAFSPYMFARSAQLPMMAIFGLPFAALAMHRLVERPTPRAAAGVAAALVLQALGCGYYTVFALLVVGGGFAYFGALSRRWRDSTYLRACALAAALSALGLAPLFWPHLSLAEGQGFSRPVAEAYRFAADWRAWFASSAWAHRWMLPLLGSWNEVLFPGFIPVVFAGAAAWLGLRGRLTGPRRATSSGEIAGFYVLLTVLSIWLAFGPAGGLYAVLYESVPLFAFIRAAGRFGLVTTLSTAALMSMMLGHLGQGGRWRPLVAATTVVLGLELCSAPRPGTPALAISPVYRTLAAQARGPVVEFPMAPRQLEINARYVLMSTAHWQPIVNGYGAFWPADIQQFARETETFPSAEALAVVRNRGIRYVVVHAKLYDRYGLGSEAEVTTRLAALEPGISLIASDQNIRLYEVKDPAAPPRR